MEIFNQSSLPDGFKRVGLKGLSIESGSITAGDPFSLPSAPLKIKLDPGLYEVDLIYKDCQEWGYRVAFAILTIDDVKAISWKPLENMYGFDSIFVDSGLASFSDSETAQLFTNLLEEWHKDNPLKNYYDLVLKNEIQNKVLPGPRVNSFCVHYPFNNDENIAIFEGGIGDGQYRVYYGVSENNVPTKILIDFDILDWV